MIIIEEKTKNEKSIIYFAKICLDLKEKIKTLQTDEKRYKRELRILMKEKRVKQLKENDISVEIRYPKSFDVGQLGVDYPELYEKYVSFEEVIIKSEKMTINEKDLKRFHPKEYNNCFAEGTPRLYLKRL